MQNAVMLVGKDPDHLDTIARGLASVLRGGDGPEDVRRDVDVVPIDAESIVPADAVRDLVEAVKYRPATGALKVVLVRDVERLSAGSLNAIAKIIEQPVPHARFVLMTTNPEAVWGHIRKHVVTIEVQAQG